MDLAPRTCVLLVAGGAAWESAAIASLDGAPGVLLLRRCMDMTDLLAAAEAGQARVAVLSADLPDLDPDAVDRLHGAGLAVVVVAADPDEHASRWESAGVDRVVAVDRVAGLAAEVRELGGAPMATSRPVTEGAPAGDGPVVAVWGPGGGPGRTTVALGIAGELGRRGRDPLLLDVDPWGGAVAQHLGVLDEVSGLLAAARPTGDAVARHRRVQRRVGSLRVVTGLPRADRWVEVRDGTVEALAAHGRREGPVVVDTGFSLEAEAGLSVRRGRNATTLEALEQADVVAVVGAADPVGLSRLARGLVELRDLLDGRPVHVVVNRMRPSLGWSEREISGMVEGFCRVAGIHFLPDDRAAVDRALLAGRTLVEAGDSALGQAFAGLVDALLPGPPRPDAGSRRGGGTRRRGARRTVRRRTAGTGRPR